MRHVDFVALARSVSAIGFGCASLGSRVDAKRGTAALARAYDAGVTWFDVAPSYGDGRAETILGSFLVGKRSQVTLCTKVGRLPGRASPAARFLKPVAQLALRVAPQLRGLAARYRPPARQVQLTGAFLRSSIEDSLKRLHTDHVDVLALHEPALEEVQREDVLRTLEDLVSEGAARCISIAGDLDVAVQAANVSQRIRVIQVPSHHVELAKRQLLKQRPVSLVCHSVYGFAGSLDRLAESLGRHSDEHALLQAQGYRGTAREMAAAFLLDLALASNPEGVVLLSMYEARHLRSNLDRFTAAPPTGVVFMLRNRLASFKVS